MTTAKVPMKMYWMGKDVEEMSREDLIEVIRTLQQEVESTRSMLMSYHRAALDWPILFRNGAQIT